MKIENSDTEKEVLVIAEIGNNHEGSYALAEEMIGLAAEAGVGAVKFQTFRTEYYVSRKDEKRFNKLKSFELKYEEFEKLSKVAKTAGILFLSTPFDLESAKFLNNIVSAFKISSGDNNFYPLIATVAQTGKPILMSTGLADLELIRYSKSLIERIWNEAKIVQDTAILHCVTSYPVAPEDANLAMISHLKRELKCTIGYSDHTVGIEASALSVALGAEIIEKHFTIDKNYSDFRDHQLSADPKEMTALVQKVRRISTLLGKEEIVPQDRERDSVKLLRRSIVASRDLPEGAVIELADITWVRPECGLPPGSEHLVLGRSLTRSIQMGEPITLEILLSIEADENSCSNY
jgi:sialic acid synthase SpsE